MQLADWVTFVTAYVAVAILPGPSAFFVAKHAAIHGRREALKCVLTIKAGDACLLAFAGSCVTFAVSISGELLIYLNWFGILWLSLLGIFLVFGGRIAGANPGPNRWRAGRAAFLIGLTNPKMLALYSSLLPMFLRPEKALLVQLAVICLTVVVAGGGCLAIYACLSSTSVLQRYAVRAGRMVFPVSGILILTVVVVLGANI